MARVSTNPAEDKFGTALGDGSLTVGAIVGIDSATGKFVATNPGVTDNFVGIVEERYDGETTAANGEAWPYVIPSAGNVYYAAIGGQLAAIDKGDPLKLGNGVLTPASGFADSPVAIAERDIGASDTRGYVRWL